MAWLLPDTLLLGGSQLEDDGEAEGADAFPLLLRLAGWDAAHPRAVPGAAQVHAAIPMMIEVSLLWPCRARCPLRSGQWRTTKDGRCCLLPLWQSNPLRI